jgi:protein arginine kinase
MINLNPIDELLKKRVGWLVDSGPDDDIAISSRIRLARNLSSRSFPSKAKPEELTEVIKSVVAAAKESSLFSDYFFIEFNKLSALDRQIFLERRTVSREFAEKNAPSALILNKDETDSVMVNEEDHLRLQKLSSGLKFKELWKNISQTDDILGEKLPIAYDEELGYLTSCPTNVGTGMRASVMLHLPGLMLTGQINQVVQAIHKLGLAVRGIFGEGSKNMGNLYQISNQSTLGETELQIIEKLETVIQQIIFHEKNSRQKLLDAKKDFVMDHVGRAYGILKHAYILSSEECLDSLSALRLGVDMGMFSSLDIRTINELFIFVQPGHLQKYAGCQIGAEERDVLRASIIRGKFKAKNKGKG